MHKWQSKPSDINDLYVYLVWDLNKLEFIHNMNNCHIKTFHQNLIKFHSETDLACPQMQMNRP